MEISLVGRFLSLFHLPSLVLSFFLSLLSLPKPPHKKTLHRNYSLTRLQDFGLYLSLRTVKALDCCCEGRVGRERWEWQFKDRNHWQLHTSESFFSLSSSLPSTLALWLFSCNWVPSKENLLIWWCSVTSVFLTQPQPSTALTPTMKTHWIFWVF